MKKDEFCSLVMESYRPAESMVRMVPADKIDWKPGPTFMTMGQLLYHLTGGLGAEFQMLLANNWPKPEEMETAMKAENMPSCGSEEALVKLGKDKATLQEVFGCLSEEDFAEKVVSVPWGWQYKFELMALHFHEHFLNHKMQLFTYLKLLGLPVNTETLYFG